MAQFLDLEQQSPGLQLLMLGLPNGSNQILSPAAFARPGHETLHQSGPFQPSAALGNAPAPGDTFLPQIPEPAEFVPGLTIPLAELLK